MSDKQRSNISERITAPAEMLAPAIVELLRRIPDTWQAYRPDDLSETQSQALFLLTAAGMVERRERMRMRMLGDPLVVEATITATGEGGGVEALTAVAAQTWEDWQDAFRRWRDQSTPSMPPFHCERLEPSEWRLTDQGVIARDDVKAGKEDAVVDFVLRRGFFDGRPRLLPDGRITQRGPVRGKGTLVRLEKHRGEPASAVEIANWGKGAEAFAAAFGKMFETRQAQGTSAAGASPEGPAGRKGRPAPPPQGARSVPMSLAELCRRYMNDQEARSDKVKPLLEKHGLRREAKGKHKWTIGLDGLDVACRERMTRATFP